MKVVWVFKIHTFTSFGMSYSQLKDNDMNNDTSPVEPLNNREVEQEHIVLPCDIFRNRFTHYVWVLTRSTLYNAALIIIISCIFTLYFASSDGPLVLAGIILWFDSVLVLILTCLKYSYSNITQNFSLRNQMVFCGEIVKYRPNSDPNTWNIIAYHMDQLFAKDGMYFPLYDGQDYFRLFASITSVDKSVNHDTNNTNDDNNENMPIPTLLDDTMTLDGNTDTSANNNSNNHENIDNSTLMYLDKAKRKAQIVFQEAENDYWMERYPDLAA